MSENKEITNLPDQSGNDIFDLIRLGQPGIMPDDIKKRMEAIPETVRGDFSNYFFEATFWKRVSEKATPLDILKKRKGSWNKEINDYNMLEYFPEDYTIAELNRLFPSWWCEDMKIEINTQLRVVYVSGFLCVEIPTLKGLKAVKRWAVGGKRIEIATEPNKHTNQWDASQPDDDVKSARTEWLKVAGKWYGIGLDIYHQKITPQLRSIFEDTVRSWGQYADDAKAIAKTFTTGQYFRDYLRSLPTVDQTERLANALSFIPTNALTKDKENLHHVTWTNFVKLRNDSQENRIKTEKFLTNLETAVERIKAAKTNTSQ
jgi:hypothetical protein